MKKKDIKGMSDGQLAIFWDYAKQEYEKGYSAFRVRLVGSSNDGMRPHIDLPDEFYRECKGVAKKYMKNTMDMLQEEMESRGVGAYKL
ncbi:hypothetical protein [Salinicoccus sp. YB14-2]|uniref:hypothetical protein n=1 Tax=Salinicoccus sp. YB14-2 TaxID=1572701 RepID=UPI001E651B15|nr:hypothetical protein [Salinicoccus sp. YB14-2]